MPHREIKAPPQVIGWREWIQLSEFDLPPIKAKVDTGARTSSLHAFNLEEFRRGKRKMVRFEIHPEQRSAKSSYEVEAPLLERRSVKPSSGHSEVRPVILTTIKLMGQVFEVELTLTRRDEMGFRMLLGRQALRGRFIVNPGLSYANGTRKPGSRRITKRKRPR